MVGPEVFESAGTVIETGGRGISAIVRAKENSRAFGELLNEAVRLAQEVYPKQVNIPHPCAVAPHVIKKIGRDEDANTLAVKRIYVEPVAWCGYTAARRWSI